MRYELKCIVFSIFWVYQLLFHSQMDVRRREDHRFTQKTPQISFISDGVKTLVMIKKCIRFIVLHSWESGRWWACEYLMATTALSMHYNLKDKPFFGVFFLCVDSKQLSEASLHRPWSPTSQGAISVAGTWPLLSETWLWDCDLPPPAPSVQSVHAWRAEVDVEVEGRWSVFLWNCCRSGQKIVLFVYMFKKNDLMCQYISNKLVFTRRRVLDSLLMF